MSRENVETVRRVFDAGARRDTAALLALYDPEVEMDVSRSPYADFVSQGRHHGLEAVRAAFRNWYDAFENVETDVDELIDAGRAGDFGHHLPRERERDRGRVEAHGGPLDDAWRQGRAGGAATDA